MPWLRWLLASLIALGCTTNHDSLARRPDAGGGTGGSGGSTGGSGIGAGNTGNVPSGGRVNPDYEPPGDDVLTIVNGVVDAASVRLCFARVDEGETGELIGEPLPLLAYAGSVVLTELEGFDPAADTIQPWLLAGELAELDGLDCAAAVERAQQEEAKVTPVEDVGAGGASGDGGAGGSESGGAGNAEPGGEGGGTGREPEPLPALEKPRLRARPVAAMPPGTLTTGRSVLLVLSGCMGGAYYADAIDTAICGVDYTPSDPSVQPIVVKLSRDLKFDKVGLQAVQGALAVGTIDVRAGGRDGTVALTFASGVDFGAIQPRPADVRFSQAELGLLGINQGLQAVGDSSVIFEQSWSSIRRSSRINDLQVARTYTAVLVGPDPLVVKRGFWNDPAFAVVDNDPTRE